MVASGKAEVWYLSLWIQSVQGDMEGYCDAMLASAGGAGPGRAVVDPEVTVSRPPAATTAAALPEAKSTVGQPGGAMGVLGSAAAPSASNVAGGGGAGAGSRDVAGGQQVPGGYTSLADQLASALGSRRQGPAAEVAPAEHVVKAELEVRAWEAHSALSTTLEEEEKKPERQRNPAKIAYLRARVKALFDDIVAAAPVR